HSALAGADFLVAAHLDGRRAEARVFLAAPVAQADLEQHFADQIEAEETVMWENGAVVARRQERLGAVVLREAPLAAPGPEAVADAFLDGLRAAGIEALPWTKETRRLRERLAFLHHLDPAAWPDVSDEALLASLGDWLRLHVLCFRRL